MQCGRVLLRIYFSLHKRVYVALQRKAWWPIGPKAKKSKKVDKLSTNDVTLNGPKKVEKLSKADLDIITTMLFGSKFQGGSEAEVRSYLAEVLSRYLPVQLASAEVRKQLEDLLGMMMNAPEKALIRIVLRAPDKGTGKKVYGNYEPNLEVFHAMGK